MNIEAGQVWESKGERYRRKILAVSDEGGAIYRHLTGVLEGATCYARPDEVRDPIFDKLITNADGTPAEPPEPERPREVETAVYRDPRGAIDMRVPSQSGQPESHYSTKARQALGANGYTCVGFRFAEDPTTWPTPIAWFDSDSKHYAMSIMRRWNRETLVIADRAVWRRLG